jgi:hypothetical protein
MACPPTRFQSSGYHGTAGRAKSPGGVLGAEWELHPPRYTPSYRAPRVMFSPVSRASNRSQPPVASRRPQHRRAPHTSQGYKFTLSHGPDSHRVSHAQPPGFGPRDPFRVAQRLALDSSRWSAVEPRAEPPERRVRCRASQDFPRHAARPAEREGWQSPTPTSGPGVTQVGSP